MLISIITPAFNASKTILETYNSLFSQSLQDWEWIVINDCSNDDTACLIEKISQKDNRVILVNNKTNSGAAVSRNIGISLARGRFIAFIDSDDLWVWNKLEKQINFMKHNNYMFTFSNYYLLLGDGSKKEYRVKKDFVTYKQLLKSNVIGCSTVMYDSKTIGKQYMPTDSDKREDHAAWLDLIKKSNGAFCLNEPLTLYRVGNKSVSSNKFKMLKYQYRMYRKHEGFGIIKSLWYTFVISVKKVFTKYWY